MLNYLRDPNQELPAEQQADATEQKEQDILTVATKGKAVRRSTTMLGVFFIIGLICLGLMIKKSAPKAAVSKTVDTEELQLEADIARLTGIKATMSNKMDEIVNKFYEFSNVIQIDVSELVKNPFELETFIQNLKDDDNGNSPIDAEMILKEQIRQKAKDLKLYSTMQSEKGVCCMINNKILYEGDIIEDFEVKQITDGKVILAIESAEITLKISK